MVDGTPFGRYRLVSLLGRGGMGEVWRAYDTGTDRVVAIKVLPSGLADDPAYETRFRREARAAASLNNPHVVPIHDYGEIEGRLFVTMPLIEGHDLASAIASGPLPPAEAVAIIDQIAGALHAAHRAQLVHRDVKPTNILLDEDGYAYLIDFGIARAASDTKLTHTGMAIGTWAYMSPERFVSDQTDPRVDIYALACVLHESLTGTTPYPGDSVEQIVDGHMFTAPPRPSTLRPGIPPQLDDVIAKGMAKNPDHRYATARDLATAARAALAAPASAPPSAPPTIQTPFPRHRNPRPQPVDSRRPPIPAVPAGMPPAPPPWQVPPNGPYLNPPPSIAPRTAPRSSGKGRLIAFSAVAVVAVIVAVVATIALTRGSDQAAPPVPPSTTASAAPTAVPNSGPFAGTFTVDVGAQTKADGSPTDGFGPAFSETWHLRSDCGANGCVATASTGGQYPETNLILDQVDGSWTAVTSSPAKCRDIDAEQWDALSLTPTADGTGASGTWIQSTTQGCYTKRTVAFKRTGDTNVSRLPDPATQARRVVAPAEGLHGTYHFSQTYTKGSTATFDEHSYGVQTTCLRSGDRCMSYFLESTTGLPFTFADGFWTHSVDYDQPCAQGGTQHIVETASYPLPLPTLHPIPVLTGGGGLATTGSSCTGGQFVSTFTRTGD